MENQFVTVYTDSNRKYEVNYTKRIARRFNEKTKMWINIHFASEDNLQSEEVEERLLEMLTDEHIRQCVEKIKGLRT